MEKKEARDIGIQQSLLALVICFTWLELSALIAETGGDANGILFFMAARTNLPYFSLLVVLFSIPCVLGGWAGREILFRSKHFLLVSLKHGAVVTLALVVYLLVRDAMIFPDEPFEWGIIRMPILFGLAYAVISGFLIRRFMPKKTDAPH